MINQAQLFSLSCVLSIKHKAQVSGSQSQILLACEYIVALEQYCI